jgi:hypothetical protein
MSSKSLNLVSKPYFHVLDDNKYAKEYSDAISHLDVTSSLMCDPCVSIQSVLVNTAQSKSVFTVDDESVYGFTVRKCLHDCSIMFDEARQVAESLKCGERNLDFILSVMLESAASGLTTFSCAPVAFEYEDYDDGRGCGDRIPFSVEKYQREVENSVHFPDYTGMPFGKMFAGVGNFYPGQLMAPIPTEFRIPDPDFAARYVICEVYGKWCLFSVSPVRLQYATGSDLPKTSLRRNVPFAKTRPFQGCVSAKAREVIQKLQDLFKPRAPFGLSTAGQFYRVVDDDIQGGVVARPAGYQCQAHERT